MADEPNAAVIADSITVDGFRLTTMEVTLHRFVLPEFNTHRVFSRNSASSRAVPTLKRIEQVENNPAVPVEWGENCRGMQANTVIDDQEVAEAVWLAARTFAVRSAKDLLALNVHKQIVNRVLEPFMWHTVIVSSTEWDSFWQQRLSYDAQPEMRVAAEAMFAAYNDSVPNVVSDSEWHLPYVSDEEKVLYDLSVQQKLCVARCARVSYLNHDGSYSVDRDIELHDRLVSASPPHLSPFEHAAIPGVGTKNFKGWMQLRELYEKEYTFVGGVRV